MITVSFLPNPRLGRSGQPSYTVVLTVPIVQTKVPGTTSWGTRIRNCDAVYRTYSVPVSTFFGKVDVRVCRSDLSLCTNPLQFAV